jgi:hypothetical protein
MEVEINGLGVTCVAPFKPKVETDYDYDVQTMDGVVHRKTKGVKTNYDLVFFNNLDDSFYEILKLFKKGEKVTLTIPCDRYNTETAEFLPTITDYNAQGQLNDGTFYYNGLAVSFERVAYELL